MPVAAPPRTTAAPTPISHHTQVGAPPLGGSAARSSGEVVSAAAARPEFPGVRMVPAPDDGLVEAPPGVESVCERTRAVTEVAVVGLVGAESVVPGGAVVNIVVGVFGVVAPTVVAGLVNVALVFAGLALVFAGLALVVPGVVVGIPVVPGVVLGVLLGFVCTATDLEGPSSSPIPSVGSLPIGVTLT